MTDEPKSAGVDELSLREMIASIGTGNPSIGGSTAAMACARIGLALVRMATVISASHAVEASPLTSLKEKIDALQAHLAGAADSDRAAFLRYLDALRERNGSIDMRELQGQAALQPLVAARLIVEALEAIRPVTALIEPKVASDVYSGAALLSASFAATMMAADTNLDHDGMEGSHDEASNERNALFKRRVTAVAAIEDAAAQTGLRF